MAERRSRLDQPVEAGRRWTMPQTFSEESFGILAEKFARFMGTAKFLVYMTLFIIVWILLNVLGMTRWHWDPYPFILLNLFFSTQASYAAPLILLAQNRQDDRDRVGLEQDRARDERNLADTEYLTREVASLRLAMRDTATRDYVRSELRDLLEDLLEELDKREAGAKAARKARKARKAARRGAQAGATQVTATQAGSTQITATQAGPTQVTATQAGPTQITATQAGSTQITATQAGPTQITATQAGPTQVSDPT